MVVSAIVGSDVATGDPIGEVAGSLLSTDAVGARVMEAVRPTVGAMVVSANVSAGDPTGEVAGSLLSTDAAAARVMEAVGTMVVSAIGEPTGESTGENGSMTATGRSFPEVARPAAATGEAVMGTSVEGMI
jgi:hypothetical protein